MVIIYMENIKRAPDLFFPTRSRPAGAQGEHMSQTLVVAAATGTNASAAGFKLNQGKFVPTETGPAYWGPGDAITFLITGEETDGAVFMAELSIPPAGGPPPHIHHREDESFYVREGTLAIRVGDRTVNVSPGDFVHVPRGTVHCFKNTGNTHAKMLVTFTPAGMEKFFEEGFYPAGNRSVGPQPLTEELLARMLAAAPNCGLEFLPPELQ
jgi:mannose-6-phosphate isomerase-like protein (cupin superfamily)